MGCSPCSRERRALEQEALVAAEMVSQMRAGESPRDVRASLRDGLFFFEVSGHGDPWVLCCHPQGSQLS